MPVPRRRLRGAAAVSLVATAGLLGTYMGSPRTPRAYAQPGAPFETFFTGSSGGSLRPGDLPVLQRALARVSSPGVGTARRFITVQSAPTCDFSVDDSTALHAAVAASVDDSVICIVDDIPDLSEQLVIDDTTLTLIGAGGDDSLASVTLTADDTRHIFATFDDTQYDGLILRNLTFTGGDAGMTGKGGSIYVTDGSTPHTKVVLIDDTFVGNYAGGDGGAIYATGLKDLQILSRDGQFQQFTGNYFTNNSSGGDGGAILARDIEDVEIALGAMSSNYAAGSGGAMMIRADDTFTAVNVAATKFIDDSAAVAGGAIAAYGQGESALVYLIGYPQNFTDQQIDGRLIMSGNYAPTGGAISMSETGSGAVAAWMLGAVQFTGNTATAGDGGAVHILDDDSGALPFPGPFMGQPPNFLSIDFPFYNLDIGTVTFTDNEAAGDGGAVHVTGLADSGGLSIPYFYDYALGGTFVDNTAAGAGGAVYVDGTLLSKGSSFVGNSATTGSGGAISVDDSLAQDPLFLYDGAIVFGSYFRGNAADDGGAAFVDDSVGIGLFWYSTFADNAAAGDGGAVASLDDSLAFRNSTFVGNEAQGDGGAVFGTLASTMDVQFSTVTANIAQGQAGGLRGSAVTIENSIINLNRAYGMAAPEDVIASTVDDSYSLFTGTSSVYATGGWTAGLGTIFSASAVVGALGDNGGLLVSDDTVIPTMLPPAGSPVIDAASRDETYFPENDERGEGFPRVVGGRADMGAVEWAPPPPPPPVFPPSAPRDVTAIAGNGEAAVAWQSPQTSGTFPVSNYQASAAPGDRSCLTQTLTCTISGLANGTEYSIRVRALNGAGWGPWSEAVTVVPEKPTVTITGTRGTGKRVNRVIVDGVVSGMTVSEVTLSFRIGTGAWREVVREVAEDGTFRWKKTSTKRVIAYAEADQVRSNRVKVTRVR